MSVILKIFLILLLSLSLHAVDIDQSTSDLELLGKSELFYDRTNSLSKKEILKKTFVQNDQDVLDLGIVPNTVLWVRFTLKNISDVPLKKILEYANSETENILFCDTNETTKEGMFHHNKNRESFNPIFTIKLQPFEKKTYYLKAHCKISTFVIKLILWNQEDFIRYSYKQKFYIIIFFTIITTLLLYNLMLFIFTKERVYFYYIAYLSAVILFESIYLGVAQLYLFSNALSEFVTKATMVYIVILVLPMILFTMEFLHTSRFPKVHFLLKTYLYALPIIALLSYDNFLFNLNILLIFFPLGFLMVLSGLLAYKHGTKEAFIYLIGWTFVITSLIFSVIESLGWYNIFEHFRYINEVAFALEALTFSIALAYRIKRFNKQLLQLQKNKQQKLQELVKKQTLGLQASLEEKDLLYKELQHRVKNNLAMVISLLQLQIHTTEFHKTKHALTDTCNRIYSFANLYELLHLNQDTQKLPTKNYFANIVNNIKVYFPQKVEFIYDIQYNISINNSIYCGLILNELVTNSLKYAFDKDGIIIIHTSKEDDHILMRVQDNGKGYKLSSNFSLGLTIVRTLTEKQLQGDLEVSFDKGTKTLISWKEKK